MTERDAMKWLNRALHEEGIPLDKPHREKLAARIRIMAAHETADALAQVANLIAGQAAEVRKTS